MFRSVCVVVFFYQKNKNIIFGGIIVLTIIKWAVDIFYVARLLEGNVEIKIWAIVAFFAGTLIAFSNLLTTTVPVGKNTDSSPMPSESQNRNEPAEGIEKM